MYVHLHHSDSGIWTLYVAQSIAANWGAAAASVPSSTTNSRIRMTNRKMHEKVTTPTCSRCSCAIYSERHPSAGIGSSHVLKIVSLIAPSSRLLV